MKGVRVSVPLRVDIGGTWDLKAFALLFQHRDPATVNIALDLPINLSLRLRSDRVVEIADRYAVVRTRPEEADFRSRFGLLLAICARCGYSGLSLHIDYAVPPRSGLGGSGALAAGFIVGMKRLMGEAGLDWERIAQTVHDVEEGLRFSFCGMQDQCAALYGGVNKWGWTYREGAKYHETRLLEPAHYEELSERLVVAYLGRGHALNVNQRQIDTLFDPATRPQWFRINEITHRAADCICRLDWESLAGCIREENDIRLSLVPERLAPEAIDLMDVARLHGVSFAIAGAGAGGCVFAFGEPEAVKTVAGRWRDALAAVPGAMLIANPGIAGQGATVEESEIERGDSRNRRLDARDRASVAL